MRHLGKASLYLLLGGFLILYIATAPLVSKLALSYKALQTDGWRDRSGEALPLSPNERGNFVLADESIPPLFDKLLLRKEDRYFYYHLGINPVSMVRGLVSYLRTGKAGGSSTITQQLVKILLDNEDERTVTNKLTESLYALALELHSSKRDILSMYEGSAYFGKNRQGVGEAALYYFNKKPSELSESEMLQLIATLGSPSTRYPGTERNHALLATVAAATESDVEYDASSTPPVETAPASTASFELRTLGLACNPCDLTIDSALTEKIRSALQRRVLAAAESNVSNGAVVVIKLPENELLAIIGSPDTKSLHSGAQLNMALEPRPIGSTAKPFIYLNAFQKGARPYTLIDDEEYSYTIGSGFAFYPKNFDGKFRGTVTMHNALSNSLNVPAVKTLEYVGLSKFYHFLEDTLRFTPRQPLERYQLGIALGELEMDLLTLSHYFTIFPQYGILKPLTLEKNSPGSFAAPMEHAIKAVRIAEPSFIELVTRILSDRETAVEQFGLKSNLTLPYKNYALKTGTSRDYHDSWTISYTPDFLVGVWLGNSDNTPMRELTGQNGAGAVWQDVMLLMYNSPYNKDTPFRFERLQEFTDSGSIEYGLPGDDYGAIRSILKNPSLILSPHDGDTVQLTKNTTIPLKARDTVDWYIDGTFYRRAKDTSFSPARTGNVSIKALGPSASETITVSLTREN